MTPLGILVHGDNHILVRGPLPGPRRARELIRRWMIPTIGQTIDRDGVLFEWRITTSEVREDIDWAVVLGADTQPQPAVTQLLDEIATRGVPIHRCPGPLDSPVTVEAWPGAD
ncbi:MAG: hypothetical protein ACKV22_07550 [Bryobacteraceae bacterium]